MDLDSAYKKAHRRATFLTYLWTFATIEAALSLGWGGILVSSGLVLLLNVYMGVVPFLGASASGVMILMGLGMGITGCITVFVLIFIVGRRSEQRLWSQDQAAAMAEGNRMGPVLESDYDKGKVKATKRSGIPPYLLNVEDSTSEDLDLIAGGIADNPERKAPPMEYRKRSATDWIKDTPTTEPQMYWGNKPWVHNPDHYYHPSFFKDDPDKGSNDPLSGGLSDAKRYQLVYERIKERISGSMVFPKARWSVLGIMLCIALGTPIWLFYLFVFTVPELSMDLITGFAWFHAALIMIGMFITFIGLGLIAPVWFAYIGRTMVIPPRTRVVLRFLAWGIFSPTIVILFAGIGIKIVEIVFRPSELVLLLVSVVIFAPLIEEPAKALGMLVFHKSINDELEGLLFGAACGLGFAIIENTQYVTMGAAFWPLMMFVRTFGSATGHVLGSAMIGFFIGKFKRQGQARFLALVVLGVLLAMAGHFVWNFTAMAFSGQFLIADYGWILTAVSVVLGMCIAGTELAILTVFIQDSARKELARYLWVMSQVEDGRKKRSLRKTYEFVKKMPLSELGKRIDEERKAIYCGVWIPKEGKKKKGRKKKTTS